MVNLQRLKATKVEVVVGDHGTSLHVYGVPWDHENIPHVVIIPVDTDLAQALSKYADLYRREGSMIGNSYVPYDRELDDRLGYVDWKGPGRFGRHWF